MFFNTLFVSFQQQNINLFVITISILFYHIFAPTFLLQREGMEIASCNFEATS